MVNDLNGNYEEWLKKAEEELDLLSTYYVETRYPGDYLELTWNDANKAFASAQKIKKFILRKIKKSK